MSSDRWVCLGLARVRAPWFAQVARWATSGSLAIDFVKTVSVEEVKARLESGRPFSALLVDGGIPGIDRDLLELAAERGCVAIVIDDRTARDWTAVGAATTLTPDLDRAELAAVLEEHATPIGRIDDLPGTVQDVPVAGGFRARTVAVTGAGGSGRSTVAMAIAQGLGAHVTHAHTTLLADLSLNADLAVLHDARDVIPGLLEVVEAHRGGTPRRDDVARLTFDVVDRHYRLLLGLRRHRDWTALRPRALRAALDGLRCCFTAVVADIDDDFEGEHETGSADIEDRNLLARLTVELADVVVVVGQPGVKGAHSMLRVIRDCLGMGITADRLLPVVNRTPRSRPLRGEMTTTLHTLLRSSHPDHEMLSPVFCPERRALDEVLRSGDALPRPIVDAVTPAVLHRLDALDERAMPTDDVPVPVAPGSLGHWSEEATA